MSYPFHVAVCVAIHRRGRSREENAKDVTRLTTETVQGA